MIVLLGARPPKVKKRHGSGREFPPHTPPRLKGTAHYIAPKRRVSIEVKRCFLSLSFPRVFALLSFLFGKASINRNLLTQASSWHLETLKNYHRKFFSKNLVVTLLIGSFVITLYRLCIYNFSFTEYDLFEITSIILNCRFPYKNKTFFNSTISCIKLGF